MTLPVVVIPVKNRLDLTRPLVARLLEEGDGCLVVLDHASTDGTTEWLGGLATPDGNLLHLVAPARVNLHELWNAGLNVARLRESACVILNNDIALDDEPRWITRLCEHLSDEWPLLCPNHKGVEAEEPVVETDWVIGWAFAMSPGLVTEYRFPTNLRWWYGDNDLNRTVVESGRKRGLVVNVGVTHIDGGSQTPLPDKEAIVAEDRRLYLEKWGN